MHKDIQPNVLKDSILLLLKFLSLLNQYSETIILLY